MQPTTSRRNCMYYKYYSFEFNQSELKSLTKNLQTSTDIHVKRVIEKLNECAQSFDFYLDSEQCLKLFSILETESNTLINEYIHQLKPVIVVEHTRDVRDVRDNSSPPVTSLNQYVNNINKYGMMDKVEEHTATEEQLILSNLKLVIKIAHEYKGMTAHLEDLIQEGNIGLMEAAGRFDRTRGTKFDTYAAHYIRMRMRNCLTTSNPIKQTTAHLNKVRKISKFVQQFEHCPTTDEISDALNISSKIVNNAMKHSVKSVTSISENLNEDSEYQLEDILPCDTNNINTYVNLESYEYVISRVQHLPEKERTAITMKFFDNKTLKEIGQHFGNISPAGAKTIIDKGLKMLKTVLE